MTAGQSVVRVLTSYPEPDWNQGKCLSPFGQPHSLTLVKVHVHVRWLGQGRSPKGATQVKSPNRLMVQGNSVSTHEVCECVSSGVMVLMLELLCLKDLSMDSGCRWCRQRCSIYPAAGWWMMGALLALLLLLPQSGDCVCCIWRCRTHP